MTLNDPQQLADQFSLTDLIAQTTNNGDNDNNNDKGPSRGRKQCPDCNNYVGARTYICDCGYEFTSKQRQLTVAEKRKLEDAATDQERAYALHFCGSHGGQIVYAGRGSCPIGISGKSYADIAEFCHNIAYAGAGEGKVYMPSAIKGWIGHKYGFDSREYRRIVKHIDRWFREIVGDNDNDDHKNDC